MLLTAGYSAAAPGIDKSAQRGEIVNPSGGNRHAACSWLQRIVPTQSLHIHPGRDVGVKRSLCRRPPTNRFGQGAAFGFFIVSEMRPRFSSTSFTHTVTTSPTFSTSEGWRM